MLVSHTHLMAIINIILSRQHDHDQLAGRDVWDTTYDFVVVGAGSAGCVLANRLSADPKVKVLLLEAGGAQPVFSEMPALVSSLYGTEIDWHFKTVPQKYQDAYYNKRLPINRGKVIGGSSVLNNMNYIRGRPCDFVKLSEHLNDSRWSWNEILRHYKKAEGNTDKSLDPHLHSFEGPIPLITPPKCEIFDAFINATLEFGYPKINDINGNDSTVGATYLQKNLRSGQRMSAATAYLMPIYKVRHNLHILANSTVTKIVFGDVEGKTRAVGVRFVRERVEYFVRASKEVVVSAGSLNTPKILMLSGVGPKHHLNELGIDVVADLPVGETLIDLVGVEDAFTFETNKDYTPNYYTTTDVSQFFINGTGPLTYKTYAALRGVNNDGGYYYVRFVPGSRVEDENGTEATLIHNFRYDYFEKMYAPFKDKNTVSGWAFLSDVKSKGSVKLRSTNWTVDPLIDPGYLTDERDVMNLVRIAELIFKLVYQSKSFKKIVNNTLNNPVPGCETKYKHSELIPNEEYLKCAVKAMAMSTCDPIATSKVGPVGDPDSVVDPSFRVRKVDRLRVADASVMPFPNAGYTHNMAVMLGELASEIILKDWGLLAGAG